MSFTFTKKIIDKGINYTDYRKLIDSLLIQNKTTGKNHPESYVEYTKVNVHRMARIDKTYKIDENCQSILNSLKNSYIFVVISEAWCGDAAWNLPVINKISESTDNIQLKIFLRDENEELINSYLTNGGKAIPKLICLEKKTLKEIFIWGPRPSLAAKIMEDYKKNPVGEKSEALANIQKWYGKDRGKTTALEICQLIQE